MADYREYSLSSGDVAAQLGVSIDTVQRWSDENRLRYLRSPGGWRKYRQTDVDTFVESLLPQDGAA